MKIFDWIGTINCLYAVMDGVNSSVDKLTWLGFPKCDAKQVENEALKFVFNEYPNVTMAVEYIL